MRRRRASPVIRARAGRDSTSKYQYRLPQGIARLHSARLNARNTGRHSRYREPARAYSAFPRFPPLSRRQRCNTAPRRHHDVTAAIARNLLGLSFDEAVAYARELKSRAAALGRGSDAIRVLPGLTTIIGTTETEALRRRDELVDLMSCRAACRTLPTAWCRFCKNAAFSAPGTKGAHCANTSGCNGL